MSQLSAPYRFVPLSRFVVVPDWAAQASHDVPFADGVCGELELRLTAHTPLCVGGQQTPATENAPTRVHFFRGPDGRPGIPGSSLKGMLRNVLEIASFAQFRQVEDQRLGIRNVSESKNAFFQAVSPKAVRAGWLSFGKDGLWHLKPCQFVRVHQGDLIEALRIPRDTWVKLKTAPERYAKLGTCRQVRFDLTGEANPQGQPKAKVSDKGTQQGALVVTGQPGSDFDKGKSAKKWEFIFHSEESTALEVPPDVMSGFQRIHEETAEWAFWLKELKAGHLPQGIPVFFHVQGPKVKSLGLAMMYKLAYPNSLHDAIRHTSDVHLKEDLPDLPSLLFGELGSDNRPGLRGRINIGLAALASDSPVELTWTRNTVLNSPKPTFFPAYVRQSGQNDLATLLDNRAELSGWKRYQTKPMDVLAPPEKSGPSVQVQLETVPANTEFSCRVRLHNLRPVELGALLWALDFGGTADARHALGMGKPFGLGQVALVRGSARLRHNSAVTSAHDEEFLDGCRLAFIHFMDQALQQMGVGDKWEKTPVIQSLLEFSQPVHDGRSFRYMDLADFKTFKVKAALSELVETFHTRTGLSVQGRVAPDQPAGFTADMDSLLEESRARQEQWRLKQEKDALKAASSPEENVLREVRELIEKGPTALSSTEKDKLNDFLRLKSNDTLNFSPEQLEELKTLATPCVEWPIKVIAKAAKKLQSAAGDE